MILVCGSLNDIVTELVCARLAAMNYPYRLLNFGLFPRGYRLAWRWDDGVPSGTLETAEWQLDVADLTGVFVRYVGLDGAMPFNGLVETRQQALLSESQGAVLALLEHLPCLVANRALPSLSNHSKPYQALLVRQTGLNTPETLLTSDPEAARAFYEAHGGEVIFKSSSGVRSVVRKMTPADLERLPRLRHGAAQFQVFLPGDNVRVHTVREEVFATRIRSQAVDYRYARRQGHASEMEATELPTEVAQSCQRLAKEMGLAIAGIDLKETPDGAWYCFEVNPCPGFAYFEQHTGQPISAALAEALKRGPEA